MDFTNAPQARTAGVCPKGDEMQSRSIMGWTSLDMMSVALAVTLSAAGGCRSAVADFYKPLTAPPDSLCGTGGGAGSGAGASTASSGGTGSGGGGGSSDCAAGGGGAH